MGPEELWLMLKARVSLLVVFSIRDLAKQILFPFVVTDMQVIRSAGQT